MTIAALVLSATTLLVGQQSPAPSVEVERLRAYHERIATVAAAAPAQVSLTTFFGPLFDLAARRAADGDPIIESRAALMALTFYVNNWPIEAFVPEARAWPRAARRTVALSGRQDLAQHFIVSALIAAASGTPTAEAAGLYKEMNDARRGSGFSFSDLAADKAGTRFGDLAGQSADTARRLYARIASGTTEVDLMPSITGLPDNLSEAEFTRRFTGDAAPAYEALVADIDRRVGALPLFQ